MGTRGGGSGIEGYKEQRNVVYTLEGEMFMRVTGALCECDSLGPILRSNPRPVQTTGSDAVVITYPAI